MEGGGTKEGEAGSAASDRNEDRLTDRRQPGRLEQISPHLAPLLRKNERAEALLSILDENKFPAQPPVVTKLDISSQHDLSDGPGIVLGVVVGSIIWIGLVAILLKAIALVD